MQFERTEQDSHRVYFDFQAKLPDKIWAIFHGIFVRLGGEQSSYDSERYFFSKFVTAEILAEIIHNTCFECGGLMKDTFVSSSKEPTCLTVRECTVCGHSHT